MYFNLDREKKQRILNYYKNEAIDSRRKKEAAKKLKIQEELNYLHEKEQEELETEKKIFQEQSKKKKALMDEYLEMLKKTKNNIPGFHFNRKNKDVIINNWGKSKEESILDNTNNFNDSKSRNNFTFDNDNFSSLNQAEKAREIIKPIDCMNQFLTDEHNQKEVNLFFLRRKNNKRDFYKNLLFSQHEESNQLNKNRYGTEDILILKQKKKNNISENPYRRKYQYSFGNSTLENNPILNPENNMRYNKYFKEFYQDNIKKEIDDMINKNDEVYTNKSNFTIEQTHNNMALNGTNIMKSFDNGNMLNKNKNDKLYRNFSGILKNDSPQDKNDFIKRFNNNVSNNNNYNKVLTNRSMSQNYI